MASNVADPGAEAGVVVCTAAAEVAGGGCGEAAAVVEEYQIKNIAGHENFSCINVAEMIHSFSSEVCLMEFNWEKFEKGPVESDPERLHVTLSSRGSFFFNRFAINALGDPESVHLMFDRGRSTIGVTNAPATSDSSFTLKPKQRSATRSGRVLYAANFLRHFGIRPEKTQSFTTARLTPDGILVLDLNATREVERV